MNYETFQPHPSLDGLISCYWTLEAPATGEAQRQRIIPDGTIEMAFILGDDIRRYTSKDGFILQPRAMILGHTIEPFYIEPTGCVNTFAVRFYPYGFANFVKVPLKILANKETPIELLFGEETAKGLEQDICRAADVKERIDIVEQFLIKRLREPSTVDSIVRATVDVLVSTKGSAAINAILKEDLSKRRQLERKFAKQIGLSPKQLGKLIRFQGALKMLLNERDESLTNIAYANNYYDQSHFIKDFKEFTGLSPKEFLGHGDMALSSIFYE